MDKDPVGWFGLINVRGRSPRSGVPGHLSGRCEIVTKDLIVNTKVELETLAIVWPGDTLVVAVARDSLSLAEAEEYRDRLRARLPGVDVVVIPATQLAVYRPDDARREATR